MARVVDLRNGEKALKIRVDMLLTLDDIIRRCYVESLRFGTEVPKDRGEALDVCLKQIKASSVIPPIDIEDQELFDIVKDEVGMLFEDLL